VEKRFDAQDKRFDEVKSAVEKRFDALGGKVNVLLAFALVGGGVGATAAYLKKQNK
jgi:hypothetical protein